MTLRYERQKLKHVLHATYVHVCPHASHMAMAGCVPAVLTGTSDPAAAKNTVDVALHLALVGAGVRTELGQRRGILLPQALAAVPRGRRNEAAQAVGIVRLARALAVVQRARRCVRAQDLRSKTT